jgi:thioredoxin reductase (NADPH)
MYDLIIIGGGPAGLSAAVYAKRACLDLVVLEKEPMGGGQIIYTEQVDNYLGLPSKNGFDLAQEFEKHARELDVPFREGSVQEVKKCGDGWQVFLKSGDNIMAKTVLLATGATHRKLGVPGEEKFVGAGVSYCATCDGAFFRDKTVAVVGGGDVALEDALYLAKACKQVYLIHRRQGLRAVQMLQDQVKNADNITFVPDSVAAEICGENKVEQIRLQNVQDKTETTLELDGVFIAVGMEPQTEMVAEALMLKDGYVPAGEEGITEAPGLFVAGDVRTKRLRQIVTAVSDGANAVTSIVEYLQAM